MMERHDTTRHEYIHQCGGNSVEIPSFHPYILDYVVPRMCSQLWERSVGLISQSWRPLGRSIVMSRPISRFSLAAGCLQSQAAVTYAAAAGDRRVPVAGPATGQGVCPWPGKGPRAPRPNKPSWDGHGATNPPRVAQCSDGKSAGRAGPHTSEGRLRCHDLAIAIATAPACRCRPGKRKKRPAGRPCPSTSRSWTRFWFTFFSFLFLGFKEASDRMGMPFCCTFIKKRIEGKKRK